MSEAANLVFPWIFVLNSVKHKFFLCVSLSKGRSNIYLKVCEKFSKVWFSGFKKFVTRPVFWKLQLTQISLNLKIIVATWKLEVWEQNCVWLYYYFNSEKNSEKSEKSCILLNKNIKFNKNETESKIENSTLRDTNLVLQLI